MSKRVGNSMMVAASVVGVLVVGSRAIAFPMDNGGAEDSFASPVPGKVVEMKRALGQSDDKAEHILQKKR